MEEPNNGNSSERNMDAQVDASVKKRRLHMLRTGKLSDCSFIVGEELDKSEEDLTAISDDSGETKLFHCHKMILATASDVFECMFYGSFNDQPNPIRVVDITPNIFELFLTFIYTDEIDPVEVNVDNFADLMYIGNKYMIGDFSNRCVDILKSHTLVIDNILPLFELGCLYDNLSLILLSYENIRKHALRLLSHNTFYKLSIHNMKRLVVFLKQLPGTPLSEDSILNALVKYGKNNNLHDSKNAEQFVKLVDAACVLSPSSQDSPSYKYLFGVI